MRRLVNGRLSILVAAATALICGRSTPAQDEPDKPFGKLTLIETVARDDLGDVNSVTIDPNGKFVYSSSWGAAAVNVFSRDAETGRITHVQTMNSPRDLDGVTAISLSGGGTYAVGAAFRSQAAVLMKRDPESGMIEFLDVARKDEKGVQGLEWAIDATFSPDARFVYVADPNGSGAANADDGNVGAVVAFEVTERDRLKWVETNSGVDNCFNGARGITFHPDGKTILVPCANAGTLVVLDWSATTGETKVRQVIKDEDGVATALEGATTVACSSDKRHIYVSSGRFSGDSAISVYRLETDGRLTLVQELFDGIDVQNFLGGNEICVSPDGRNVYAAATRSGSLACLARDPETGKLTFIETLVDSKGELSGAAGVCVSPDGKHVYVAVEYSDAISVFARDTAE